MIVGKRKRSEGMKGRKGKEGNVREEKEMEKGMKLDMERNIVEMEASSRSLSEPMFSDYVLFSTSAMG